MTNEWLTPISDLERDALAELANIAMARAAMSIRQMVGYQVLLSVPSVEILAPAMAVQRLAKPGNPKLIAAAGF